MITIKEQWERIGALPERLRKQYAFGTPFPYSAYRSIQKDGCIYYPDLDCLIMNEICVTWPTGDSDLCEMNVDNPSHMAEIRKRVNARLSPDIIGIARKIKGRMQCLVTGTVPKGFSFIPFDGTRIYYKQDEYDLESDNEMRVLAECLFAVRRYEVIEIIPYKDEEPAFWGGNCV